jgi:hypothetical protein
LGASTINDPTPILPTPILPRPGFHRKDVERYAFHGLKGVSDILGILPPRSKLPGRSLAVEVKRRGKEPKPERREFVANVTRNGGVAMWVTSVADLEKDMDEFLSLDQMRMEF